MVIVSTQKTQLGISSSQISVCAFLHRIAGANDFRFLFSGGFFFGGGYNLCSMIMILVLVLPIPGDALVLSRWISQVAGDFFV